MGERGHVRFNQIGNYKFLGKILGKGTFAKVELAEHKLTGVKVFHSTNNCSIYYCFINYCSIYYCSIYFVVNE